MIDPIELHRLADGDVSAEESAVLRDRLQASPNDMREYESIVTLKRAMVQYVKPVDSKEAWKACRLRIRDLERARSTERIVTRYAWALCGVFFIAIVGGGLANRARTDQAVSISDISRIATTLAPPRTPPKKDAARERWLDDLLGQARRSVDPNRLEIVQYANGQLDGRPVTAFYLQDTTGRLTLLAMPGAFSLQGAPALPADRTFKLGHLQGLNCVVWSDGKDTWCLVANRDYEDLVNTASLLTQAPPR
jgi:hypothetical protein